MYKVCNIFREKLTFYVMGCVLIAGVISVASAYSIIYFGQNFVESWYDDEETTRRIQQEYVEDLQQYVKDNQIEISNISMVKNWINHNSYIYLSIYQNNKVVFNSDYDCSTSSTLEIPEDVGYEELLLDDENLYKLTLADGTVASVDIFWYDYWQYTYYIIGAGLGCGVLIFMVIFTQLWKRKVNYIHTMEKELCILEGGNLDYPITIKGEDELASLAKGIEQMRLSVVENMDKEQKMLQANKDLVTAMSHDLRTPLTTLTGYLEILNMNTIEDEERRKHYLELSLEKTREIKDLSDQLFEYFLIYGENRKRLEVESVPAHALVTDLMENQFLGLEEDGFQIECINHIDVNSGNCMINSQYMQRVLNNILSNLDKYADKEVPIEVSATKEQSYLIIRVRNGICKNIEKHESTKIGLITCERIMKLHHGEFQKYETEDEFTVKLTIPMEGSRWEYR